VRQQRAVQLFAALLGRSLEWTLKCGSHHLRRMCCGASLAMAAAQSRIGLGECTARRHGARVANVGSMRAWQTVCRGLVPVRQRLGLSTGHVLLRIVAGRSIGQGQRVKTQGEPQHVRATSARAEQCLEMLVLDASHALVGATRRHLVFGAAPSNC
jgi:hypothetical protein